MLRSTRALLEAAGASPSLPAVAVGTDGGAPFSMTFAHDDWRQVKSGGGLHDDGVPPGPWATVLFDPHEYEPGHAIEVLSAASGALAPGGALLCTAPPRYPAERWDGALRERFGAVDREGEVWRARRPLPVAAPDPWAYEAFGCRFATGPGLFSPRGVDPGTALMLEHLLPLVDGRRLLDLGCGAGVVGVLAAKRGAAVTAVDVRARALRFTRLNAAANGVAIAVQPGDGLDDLGEARFDLIATNPPYHEDFGVARRFVEGARERLEQGGALYLVVRRGGWYAEKLRAVFGGFRLIERDGYSLFIAEKRSPSRPAVRHAAPPPRKHLKRLEQAARRNKRR